MVCYENQVLQWSVGTVAKRDLYMGYTISQLNAIWNCIYQNNNNHKKVIWYYITIRKQHGHFAEKFILDSNIQTLYLRKSQHSGE